MLQKVEKRTNENGEEIRTDASGREYKVWYDMIGNEFHEYTCKIRENNTPKKKINLDDALLDDDFQSPDYNWSNTFEKPKDENNLSDNDFYRMEFKQCMYALYK